MPKKIKNLVWIPLVGRVEPTKDGFSFTPAKDPTKPELPGSAIVKTDHQFLNGTISFATSLHHRQDKVQLILNHGTPVELWIGLNPATSAYGMLLYRNGLWEGLSLAGAADALELGREYHLTVEVTGSRISLYVDGVEVCRANYLIQKAQIAMMVMAVDSLRVSEFAVSDKQPTIFVVMQYTDEFNSLYAEVIRPLSKEFGYRAIRADDRYTHGLVIEDITRQIREATVVIADVTPDNCNVFYEVGYSHGLNKPTILLSDRKRERLPFNISGFRTLFYDNTIGGKSDVETRLRSHLKEINSIS